MRDVRGVEIKLGDTVAYAVRRFSRGGLTVGKVARIYDRPRWNRDNTMYHQETVVVEKYRTRTMFTQRAGDAYRKVESRFPTRFYLTDSDRVVVLPKYAQQS